MREETRKRLNRLLWIERAKYAGIGLAAVAAIAVVVEFENLDMAVTDFRVQGQVEAIDPLVSKTSAATGVNVGVLLASGKHVRVIAEKQHAPHIGDKSKSPSITTQPDASRIRCADGSVCNSIFCVHARQEVSAECDGVA